MLRQDQDDARSCPTASLCENDRRQRARRSTRALLAPDHNAEQKRARASGSSSRPRRAKRALPPRGGYLGKRKLVDMVVRPPLGFPRGYFTMGLTTSAFF